VPLDLARESREGFELARAVAEAAFRRRQEEFQRQVRVESSRAKLSGAADRAFGRHSHAALFLNSAHPSLNGMHPIAYCVDDTTLVKCLALLPRPRP
jgi:hypothetical protein